MFLHCFLCCGILNSYFPTFSSIKYAIRCVRTRVFPDPAPARIKTGPSVWNTASCCIAFKLSYLLIYIGAGLIGAGTSIIFTLGNNPNTVSAGASGAIFGVMGGLLYYIISDIIQKKRHRVEEIGLTGMIFMVASALSYGFFSTGIDNAAHIGGLVGGFLITMISRFVI